MSEHLTIPPEIQIEHLLAHSDELQRRSDKAISDIDQKLNNFRALLATSDRLSQESSKILKRLGDAELQNTKAPF